jgi:hypothetical protein
MKVLEVTMSAPQLEHHTVLCVQQQCDATVAAVDDFAFAVQQATLGCRVLAAVVREFATLLGLVKFIHDAHLQLFDRVCEGARLPTTSLPLAHHRPAHCRKKSSFVMKNSPSNQTETFPPQNAKIHKITVIFPPNQIYAETFPPKNAIVIKSR